MNMLARLKELNPDLRIYEVSDNAFSKYGKVHVGYDFSPYLAVMEQRPVPENGYAYVANDEEIFASETTPVIAEAIYGGMPIQVGYCNGRGHQLNALEYHKGSETVIAATALVLLLGDLRDIENNRYKSANIEAFFVPKGTACELYGTTLHYAPCALGESGFKAIIVLPAGTNAPLTAQAKSADTESELLSARSKWLIAHPDSADAAQGAFVGIVGDNIRLCIA